MAPRRISAGRTARHRTRKDRFGLIRAIGLGAALAFGVVLAGPAVSARDVYTNMGYDKAVVHAVFDAIKQAVATNSPQPIEKLIQYPLYIRTGSDSLDIRNPGEFEQHFSEVFTPDIVQVVRDQNFSTLLVNAQGVMFGSGQIWITAVCADNGCKKQHYRIVTIQHGPQR